MRGTRAMALTRCRRWCRCWRWRSAGCGDGSTSKPAADSPTPVICDGCNPPTSDIDPGAVGPYAVRGAASGGVVTVLTDHGLDGTLDPSGASDAAAVSILSGLVTRSLTQYRYDPRSRETVLVPDLATNLGQHNDDYTKWIFRVQTGIRFADGMPVTPADVVRGVRRCRHGVSFATSPCLDVPFTSVKVHDQHYVQFRFDEPYPDLPYLAATPAVGPVPRGTTDRYGPYARHPAATGPYRDGAVPPRPRARPGAQPAVGPEDRPGPHAVPRPVRRTSGHLARTHRATAAPGRRVCPDHADPGRCATRAVPALVDSGEAARPRQQAVHDVPLAGQPHGHRTSGAARPDLGLPLRAQRPMRRDWSPASRPCRRRTSCHRTSPGVLPSAWRTTAASRPSPRVARQMLAGRRRPRYSDSASPTTGAGRGRRLRDALVHSLRASGFDPRPLPAPATVFPGQTPANRARRPPDDHALRRLAERRGVGRPGVPIDSPGPHR